MKAFDIVLVLSLLAYLLETGVESVIGEYIDLFVKNEKARLAILKSIPVVAGILIALFYKMDVVYLLADFVKADWLPLAQPSWVGMVMTGFGIGKGSSYLHDVFKKYFIKPTGELYLPDTTRGG